MHKEIEANNHRTIGNHPNIIKYLGCGIDMKNLQSYTVLDFANAGTIAKFFAKDKKWCSKLASDLANGLKQVHACNIVHRDLHGDNCLVYIDDSGIPTAKIADFGLAQNLNNKTHLITIRGRMRIYAPEAVDEVKVYTLASDIYMFGAAMYEMLTGTELFHQLSTKAAITARLEGKLPPMPKLNEQYEQVILACLSYEEETRPSLDQIIAMLK